MIISEGGQDRRRHRQPVVRGAAFIRLDPVLVSIRGSVQRRPVLS
jgi:hypothetical protein